MCASPASLLRRERSAKTTRCASRRDRSLPLRLLWSNLFR